MSSCIRAKCAARALVRFAKKKIKINFYTETKSKSKVAMKNSSTWINSHTLFITASKMYSYNKVNMFNIQNKIKKKNNLQIKKQNTSKPRRTITAMTITTTIKKQNIWYIFVQWKCRLRKLPTLMIVIHTLTMGWRKSHFQWNVVTEDVINLMLLYL